MRELELYKLLLTEDNQHETELAQEIRWVSDDELLVWVSYSWIKEFIESIEKMFGTTIFDDGGFNGNFQYDCVCFDLEKILGEYDIDLKSVFPLEKYN